MAPSSNMIAIVIWHYKKYRNALAQAAINYLDMG